MTKFTKEKHPVSPGRTRLGNMKKVRLQVYVKPTTKVYYADHPGVASSILEEHVDREGGR